MRISRKLLALIVFGSIAGGTSTGFLMNEVLATNAQGTRKYTPDGFEFGVTTPVLKYHFPRAGHKGTTFKGTWIAENVEEIRPNYVIDSAEIKLADQPVAYFTLGKPTGDWPQGLYRLEISADDVLVHTERFVIR